MNRDYATVQHKDILLLCVLALFCVDFYLQGIAILIAYSIVYISFTRGKVTCLLSLLLFAIIFSSTYFCYSNSELSILKNVVALPLAFMLGCKIPSHNSSRITFLIVFCSFFMFMHSFLNFAYNYNQHGISVIGMRVSSDFWTGETSSSTGQATKMTPLIACLFYLIFYRKGLIIKLISILAFILIIIFDLALGGRSALALIALGFVIALIISHYKEKNALIISKLTLMLSLFVGILALAYMTNAFNIQDIFEDSSFNQRFNAPGGQNIEDDDRMQRKGIYLANLLNFPFGGQNLCYKYGIGHAHDLWLDCFDMAGLIPLICIVIYSITSIIRGIRYFKSPTTGSSHAVLLLTFILLMNVQFFLEPIIEGSPKLLILYCFVDGMIFRYNKERNLITTKRQYAIYKVKTISQK